MYSEALKILDANTAQYMIEVQQEEIDRLKEENRRIMAEKDAEIERLQALLAADTADSAK